MGRPPFHTASVSLRDSGFGDPSTHALKVSNSSTKLNTCNRGQVRRVTLYNIVMPVSLKCITMGFQVSSPTLPQWFHQNL